MRHGRDSLPPAGRHAASATPADPAAPAGGRHSRHADGDIDLGDDRSSRRLRAVPDLPAPDAERGSRRRDDEPRRTPRLADILAATSAESPAPPVTPTADPRPLETTGSHDRSRAVPTPRRAPEPRSTTSSTTRSTTSSAPGPAAPVRLGDHPSLPSVPPVPRPSRPTGLVPPQGAVTPPPAPQAPRPTPPADAAPTTTTRATPTRHTADAPATAVTESAAPAPAKRAAARRSDPSEIAARATTTLISSQPGAGRRRADRALIAPPVPSAAEQGPATPVFADGTGRRARHWRLAAIAATAVCASYVGVVAIGAVAGPVGPTASPTLLPPPTLAPPAPVAPTVDARNIAEVEPTTTKRSARATTTTRSTPRSTTPRVPRTTPRPAVVAPAPAVPVAPRQAPLVQQDEDEDQGGAGVQQRGAAPDGAQAT